MSNQKDIKLPEGLQNYIQQSRNNNNRGENEDDFNTCWSLKSMFASVKDDAIKILPTLSEFISAMTSENMFIRKGCIYDSGDGPKFCESSSSAPKDSNVIIGAIFKVMDQKLKKEDEKKSSTAPIIRFFPGIFLASAWRPIYVCPICLSNNFLVKIRIHGPLSRSRLGVYNTLWWLAQLLPKCL